MQLIVVPFETLFTTEKKAGKFLMPAMFTANNHKTTYFTVSNRFMKYTAI